MHPSWTLIIVVLLAVLLFMRPGKLSGLMEDLGKGIKGFRKGMSDPQPPPEDAKRVTDQSATTDTSARQEDRASN
jgi:sec-independent protein translocase protein TatA